MYQIRETFKAKPGKAKELVKKFKAAIPHLEKLDTGSNYKVLTDIASDYWTVVIEHETKNIGTFISELRTATVSEELQNIMSGYIDLVEGGKREIFLIE